MLFLSRRSVALACATVFSVSAGAQAGVILSETFDNDPIINSRATVDGPNSPDRDYRPLAAQQVNPPEKPGPANRTECDRPPQIALVRIEKLTFQ